MVNWRKYKKASRENRMKILIRDAFSRSELAEEESKNMVAGREFFDERNLYIVFPRIPYFLD